MSQREDQDIRKLWKGIGWATLIMAPIYFAIFYMLVWR